MLTGSNTAPEAVVKVGEEAAKENKMMPAPQPEALILLKASGDSNALPTTTPTVTVASTTVTATNSGATRTVTRAPPPRRRSAQTPTTSASGEPQSSKKRKEKLKGLFIRRKAIRKSLKVLEERELDFDDLEKEEHNIKQEEKLTGLLVDIEAELRKEGVIADDDVDDEGADEDAVIIVGTGFQSLDERISKFLENQPKKDTEVWIDRDDILRMMTDQYQDDVKNEGQVKKIPSPETVEFGALFEHTCDVVLPIVRQARIEKATTRIAKDYGGENDVVVPTLSQEKNSQLVPMGVAENLVAHLQSVEHGDDDPEPEDEDDLRKYEEKDKHKEEDGNGEEEEEEETDSDSNEEAQETEKSVQLEEGVDGEDANNEEESVQKKEEGDGRDAEKEEESVHKKEGGGGRDAEKKENEIAREQEQVHMEVDGAEKKSDEVRELEGERREVQEGDVQIPAAEVQEVEKEKEVEKQTNVVEDSDVIVILQNINGTVVEKQTEEVKEDSEITITKTPEDVKMKNVVEQNTERVQQMDVVEKQTEQIVCVEMEDAEKEKMKETVMGSPTLLESEGIDETIGEKREEKDGEGDKVMPALTSNLDECTQEGIDPDVPSTSSLPQTTTRDGCSTKGSSHSGEAKMSKSAERSMAAISENAVTIGENTVSPLSMSTIPTPDNEIEQKPVIRNVVIDGSDDVSEERDTQRTTRDGGNEGDAEKQSDSDSDIQFLEEVKGEGPIYEPDTGAINTSKNDAVWAWLRACDVEVAVVQLSDDDDEDGGEEQKQEVSANDDDDRKLASVTPGTNKRRSSEREEDCGEEREYGKEEEEEGEIMGNGEDEYEDGEIDEIEEEDDQPKRKRARQEEEREEQNMEDDDSDIIFCG